MFEDLRLRKYKNKLVGFAYEYFDPKFDRYGMKTYLVIKEDDYYSFVKYRTYIGLLEKDIYEIRNKLLSLGYQPLNYWVELNSNSINNKQYIKTNKFEVK